MQCRFYLTAEKNSASKIEEKAYKIWPKSKTTSTNEIAESPRSRARETEKERDID